MPRKPNTGISLNPFCGYDSPDFMMVLTDIGPVTLVRGGEVTQDEMEALERFFRKPEAEDA